MSIEKNTIELSNCVLNSQTLIEVEDQSISPTGSSDG